MKKCKECTFRIENIEYPNSSPYCMAWGKKTTFMMKCHMFLQGIPFIDRIKKLEEKLK